MLKRSKALSRPPRHSVLHQAEAGEGKAGNRQIEDSLPELHRERILQRPKVSHRLRIVGHEQCYQIGRFLKILCVQFFLKSSSNVSRPFGLFENITLQVKTAVASFWATFAKNGLFLFQHLATLDLRPMSIAYVEYLQRLR